MKPPVYYTVPSSTISLLRSNSSPVPAVAVYKRSLARDTRFAATLISCIVLIFLLASISGVPAQATSGNYRAATTPGFPESDNTAPVATASGPVINTCIIVDAGPANVGSRCSVGGGSGLAAQLFRVMLPAVSTAGNVICGTTLASPVWSDTATMTTYLNGMRQDVSPPVTLIARSHPAPATGDRYWES